MTKHNYYPGRTLSNVLKKLALMGLCLIVFQLNATARSQVISLSITRGSISDVFKAIENQSDYKFFYNDNQIDITSLVDVKAQGSTIESVLNDIFKGTDITYKIVNNHVVLTNSKIVENSEPAAQNGRTVIGKVSDEGGEPLIGVSVSVQGTSIGALTDANGDYHLENVPDGAVLIFSYLGYLQQNVPVGTQSRVDMVMPEDTQRLDAVVVVGYGQFKKRDLTGAITQVRGEDIADLPLRSVADALQGKAAGVTITTSSGSPGSLANIRIRGVGTINGNDPLYVVDGMPQSDIGWLNARDIENIEILKDASAQAIYGARAANGVILLSTKRGASGDSYKSNIEFDMHVGFQSFTKRYDVLDAEGFMEYKNRAYAASGRALIEDFSTPEKREQILAFLGKNGGRQGTDWWDAITRKPSEAINHNYNLAFSGGMDKLRYRSSFGYMKQDGILKGSDYERLSGRLNLDSKVTEWFDLSANVNIIYESRRNLDENNSYSGTVFSTIAADPITPIYRDNLVDIPDFLQARIMGGYEPTNPWSRYTGVIYSNKPNTVSQVDRMAQNRWHRIATKANLSGDFKLFPFLTFKSSLALDLTRRQDDRFTPKYYLDGDEYSTYATVSRNMGNTSYWVFDNYLTYNQQFGKHTVNAMVGTSAELDRYEEVGASKQGMVNNDPSQQIINAGTLNPWAGGYVSTSTLNSYFGRVFYSYDNRYMLTANIRRDGSSRFADGNRWGVFPSVSAGWNFSEEEFMKNITWLSESKLRVSWGEIGNQTIPGGAYLDTYGNGGYLVFGNPYGTALTGLRNQVGNKDLKWETTRQFDIGLDLAFLKGALRASVDYFIRDTKDMLVRVPVPSGLGFPNTPYMNAGSMSNKGFELSLGYNGGAGREFKYSIDGNISTYRNEVKSLGSGANIPGTGIHLGYFSYTMTEPGKPVGYFYGYETDGVFQNQSEIDNYVNNGQVVMPGAKPGDLKFRDRNSDGKIDDKDRTMTGNPHPDFTFGLTFSAQYKGFDFSAFFQGSVGNELLNVSKYDIYSGTGWYNAPKDILTTFWNGEGSTNKNFAIDADSRMNLEMSDWYVEDGTYVRLKNLQIGYTLPASFTQKFTVNRLRVYVAAQNLFTITNYSGLDPEIGEIIINNPLYRGCDMGFYPQARTFMFGLSLKL